MKPEPSSLDRLLNPRAVAIIGASPDVSRIGGQPVRTLSEFGYAGKVYPVNPRHTQIAGLTCYPSPDEMPDNCDVAIIAVAKERVVDVVSQCGARGVSYAIVLSAGFSETGKSGERLQKRVVEAARRHDMRLVGPNCQGVLSLPSRLYAGFGATFQNSDLGTGRIAMVTQSGGFGYSVVGQADALGVRFNHVISTGNEADLDAVELIRDLLVRDDVDAVAAYIEGVRDGRGLLEVGDLALELGKPVLVWKVGKGKAAQRAARSHTGNLTSSHAVYEAAFRQGGFIEVDDVHQLVDAARMLQSGKRARSRSVSVVSISGGAGVLLADHLERGGLSLPRMSTSTRRRLREVTPSYASLNNPIDVTAQVFNNPEMFGTALGAILDDPGTGQLIISNAAMQGPTAEHLATSILEQSEGREIPVAVAWGARPGMADGPIGRLREGGVPVFETPARAAWAAAALTDFELRRRRVNRRAPSFARLRRDAAAQALLEEADVVLAERQAKQFLSHYGVPCAPEVLVSGSEVDVCELVGSDLSYPVVAKLAALNLEHKTELGLVRTGINTAEELVRATADLFTQAGQLPVAGHVEGVSVQRQLTGTEVIVGTVNDAYFGPMVMVGLGGIYAEYLKDVAYRFAPVTLRDAREMLRELRAWPILNGARAARCDVEALAGVVVRASEIAWIHRDSVKELDINPVFVGEDGDGASVADAFVVRAASSV